MSKLGRKPIDTTGVQVSVKEHEVHFKGAKNSGVFELPPQLTVKQENSTIRLVPQDPEELSKKQLRDLNRIWGLNYALLRNKIIGSKQEFTHRLIITGLGYKAVVSGNKLALSLGFSHKIDFPLPAGVTAEVDKTGQQLTLKATDKVLLGQVASSVRALRPVEPYKGTGVKFANEVVLRKAGKK